jgi:proteasome accessory factor B
MPIVDSRTGERRLLRLAAWLLTHGPATRAEVYAAFPKDYAGKKDAKERKWTRDKDDLGTLGAPIHFSEEDGTYTLETGGYYLKPPRFTEAEAAVVATAGRAALQDADHPLRADLESALRKLLVASAGLPPRAVSLDLERDPAASPQLRKWLAVVFDALEQRKVLHLSYWVPARDEVTERDVEPYGCAWRRGEWLLVGWCRAREAVRVFYLRRVRALGLARLRKRPPHYAIPARFDVRDWSRQEPWEFLAHEPREALVRFTGSLANIAPRLVPRAKLATAPDNARLARLVVRDVDGLVRQCLAWGPEAELLEPPDARERARAILESAVGGAR